MANYAMIEKGSTKVSNTIVADKSFNFDGFYFVLIAEGVFCQSGMYYNKVDGAFYFDEEFSDKATSA